MGNCYGDSKNRKIIFNRSKTLPKLILKIIVFILENFIQSNMLISAVHSLTLHINFPAHIPSRFISFLSFVFNTPLNLISAHGYEVMTGAQEFYWWSHPQGKVTVSLLAAINFQRHLCKQWRALTPGFWLNRSWVGLMWV